MRISKYLSADRVIDLAALDKAGALRELAAVVATSRNIGDPRTFQKAILDREAILSTGIGLGIAVPHAKVATVKDFVVGIGRSKRGIEWESLDGKAVHIVLMIAANDKQAAEYTKVLAGLVTRVKPEETRKKILAAPNAAAIVDLMAD